MKYFYWECNNQHLSFNPSKKYLIYFKGCYCPPHRGHFSTVKRFLDMGTNIYAMIHQMGSSRRHGVPYKINRKIWRTYIDELLPSNRVFLRRFGSTSDIYSLPIINDIDTIVYIRGNENYEESKVEKVMIRKFRPIMNDLENIGINMVFYYLNRPLADKLSATKFTKALIKTKRRCKKHGDECKYNKIKYFFPFDLEKNICLELARDMQKYYLTE